MVPSGNKQLTEPMITKTLQCHTTDDMLLLVHSELPCLQIARDFNGANQTILYDTNHSASQMAKSMMLSRNRDEPSNLINLGEIIKIASKHWIHFE